MLLHLGRCLPCFGSRTNVFLSGKAEMAVKPARFFIASEFATYVFSANGERFIPSLGQRPRKTADANGQR